MFKSGAGDAAGAGPSEVDLGSSPSWREYETTFSRLLHDEVVNRGGQGSSGGDDLVRSASAVDLVRAETLMLSCALEMRARVIRSKWTRYRLRAIDDEHVYSSRV
mmetsp:Transcript_6025/g.20300  ORF Transcript_6025/g.20300 Transcript_6025/m.20300 type:complete len:105 (+) Transcript_6025:240-554(+)